MKFKEVKLEEICTVQRGASPRPIKDFVVDEGIPWVKIADATADSSRYISRTKEYIKREGKEKSRPVVKGDLILSNSATPGLPKIMKIDACIHDGWLLLRNFNGVLKEFLYYTLVNKRRELVSNATGTVFNNLKTDTVKNFKILLPDIKTQKIITKTLQNIDEKIDINNYIISNLEELAQTLFKRWFVDFEFPNEEGKPYKSSGGKMVESELGMIPKGWSVNNFEKIITIGSGKRPKSKVDTQDENNQIPIIGASKVMGYTETKLFDEPIIVIGRVGTHGIVQRLNVPCWPSDNTFVLRSKYEEFMYHKLKTIDYKSINRGSTQPLLTQKDIKNVKVILPSNDLLIEFEDTQKKFSSKISQLKEENTKLENLRDILLPKLLSGEIELPDDMEVTDDVPIL